MRCKLLKHGKNESFVHVVSEDMKIITGVPLKQKTCIVGVTGIGAGKDVCMGVPKRKK